LAVIADAWRPWRGVAAHLLWGYYHVVKRREGVAVDTKPVAAKPAKRKPTEKAKRNGRTKRPGAVRTKP
jgi:DNA-3-methyladenine glycosylase II